MDEGTHVSAASFVKDVSTAPLWATILECWATIYLGLRRKILVDQGSPFSNLFITIGALSNLDFQRTAIEYHTTVYAWSSGTINLCATPTTIYALHTQKETANCC